MFLLVSRRHILPEVPSGRYHEEEQMNIMSTVSYLASEVIAGWEWALKEHEKEFLAEFAPNGAKSLHAPSWGAEFMLFWYLGEGLAVSHQVIKMETWHSLLDKWKSDNWKSKK